MDARGLHGNWSHSHEEDRGDELVFRPQDYELPPARGRSSIEFAPDGTYVEGVPGPVDRPEHERGTWTLDGDRLDLGHGRVWELRALEPDRLVVRVAR